MINTLTALMKQALADYTNQDRKFFVLNHYGQVVATLAQIMWSSQTEVYLNDQAANPFSLQEWFELNVTQLEQLTELVRGELTDLQRKVIVALVTTDVHARDIVEELKNDNVSSIFDFKWVKQLRYYWDDEVQEKNCKIKQVSATLNYGYEYMGATSRLVITPLTDRCWITISNALHIYRGANPAGPAGTGKTESTKDLAKAIACQCIVFNCSDQVDYIMMGRLFSGLCQQGCWTCLDEFNRIDIEVLSVIAQQLLLVSKALKAQKVEFTFEDGDIPLKPEFGCHVTMNPGYAGRTELPDNLKVLFRPVAMMIPDYGLIAEIMLFAEGFGNAKVLSKKMV
jgi:dynein heavy chain